MKRKYKEFDDSQADEQATTMKRFFTASLSQAKKSKKTSSIPKPSSPWTWNKTLLYYDNKQAKPSEKIAAFDFDNTLVKTSLFKHGIDAWSILYPNCKEKLSSLHRDGFKLVIFTNQAGIGRAKGTREKVITEKTGRLMGFVTKVDLPFQIFVCTQKDKYYKPSPGMWDFMKDQKNGGKQIDKDLSFFVGDAAGRKKDHSDSDKKFAANCGVTFYTEEEFFNTKNKTDL